MNVSPPVNLQELVRRANALSGITLQQLANQVNITVPSSTHSAKGWAGNLLEIALGADAKNAPEPDFRKLGIELKTIPIDKNGKANESTYICIVQLDPGELKDWDTSLVKAKLNKVLWIPIEGDKDIPLSLRRIGTPVLWKPDVNEEKQLRQDWQELCDMIVMGEIDKISSSMGKYLQIRPKAANAKALTKNKNQYGETKATLPRGFYLRATFTQSIIGSLNDND